MKRYRPRAGEYRNAGTKIKARNKRLRKTKQRLIEQRKGERDYGTETDRVFIDTGNDNNAVAGTGGDG